MAIATATSLDVYVGGKLLFEEVGFKLEPRERMTLSGRNGAGKSTLLRVLAGELKPDAGSLTVQRGARVALHDQRPPRHAGDGGGARAAGGTDGWRGGGGDDARLFRSPAAARSRRRLPLARRRPCRSPGARLRLRAGRPPAPDLLRRRADPRLARPLPRR